MAWPKELWLMPITLFLQLLWSFQGVFWNGPASALLGDAWILHLMAVNYLDHGEFYYRTGYPTLFQLPAYPYLISLFYDFLSRDARWVLGCQVLVTSCLTPFLIFCLRPYLGKWRWVFAILWITDIHHLLYTTVMTTEFFICCLWTCAWMFFSSTHQHLAHSDSLHPNNNFSHSPKTSHKMLIFGSLCLGLAAWIKPMSLYIIIFMLMFWTLAHCRKPITYLARGITLSIFIFSLILIPLLLRNQKITGEFPRYTTISSFNLWFFNIPYFISKKEGISIQKAREGQVEVMRQHLNKNGANIAPIQADICHDRARHMNALGLSELEYARVADELNASFFKEHGIAYLFEHLKHSFKLFTVSNLSWLKLVFFSYDAHSFGYSPNKWWDTLMAQDKSSWFLLCRIWELASVAVFCLLSLSSLFLRIKTWQMMPIHWLALSIIAYVPLVSGINVWGRFRFLIMPMLIFMAVDGLKLLWKLSIKNNKTVATPNIAP